MAKFSSYPEEISLRKNVAENYNQQLKACIVTPSVKPDRTSIWAQYTVRVENRDILQEKLKETRIVHYPMRLHLQECFQYLELKEGNSPVAEQLSKEVMSLLMNLFLKEDEIEYVSQVMNNIRRADDWRDNILLRYTTPND